MEIIKIAVNGTQYDIKDTITSINGKSGAIDASDIASVLTAAGYKLTDADTTYQFSQNDNTLQMGINGGEKSDIYTPAIPASLPASDVYSWAKASTKPTYTASEVDAIPTGEKGAVNGVASLDSSGKVPQSQLPSLASVATSGSYDDLENKPTTLPASDVSAWAKASAKPSYIAGEVVSIFLLSISTSISSSCTITGSNNDGRAETIIYMNNGSSDLTVTVPTTYKTPDGEAIELTCPVGGYCEVSYLNIGGTIFARGL